MLLLSAIFDHVYLSVVIPSSTNTSNIVISAKQITLKDETAGKDLFMSRSYLTLLRQYSYRPTCWTFYLGGFVRLLVGYIDLPSILKLATLLDEHC
jgi:hypothetical protein